MTVEEIAREQYEHTRDKVNAVSDKPLPIWAELSPTMRNAMINRTKCQIEQTRHDLEVEGLLAEANREPDAD